MTLSTVGDPAPDIALSSTAGEDVPWSALRGRWSLIPLLVLLVLSSCRFEDRTPGGSRPEDTALRNLVADFYQAVGRRDPVGLGHAVFPAATVLLASTDGATLVPVRTLIEVPEQRNEGDGVRVSRIDLRPDGAVATARVVVVAVNSIDGREFESTDFLTIAHREGVWRIAQIACGPWRVRSAP